MRARRERRRVRRSSDRAQVKIHGDVASAGSAPTDSFPSRLGRPVGGTLAMRERPIQICIPLRFETVALLLADHFIGADNAVGNGAVLELVTPSRRRFTLPSP